jgi:hypothetical protein
VAISNPNISTAGITIRAVERLSKGALAVAVEAPVNTPTAAGDPLAAFTLRIPIWSDSDTETFPIRFSRSMSEQAKQELNRLRQGADVSPGNGS